MLFRNFMSYLLVVIDGRLPSGELSTTSTCEVHVNLT
jgi:hypothetical protein